MTDKSLCGARTGRLNCGCCDEVRFVCDLPPHPPETPHRDEQSYGSDGDVGVRGLVVRWFDLDHH